MTDKHFDQPVELRPAFIFTCHDCGRESFVHATAVIFHSNEEREVAMEQLGLGFNELEGAIAGVPESVECSHCGAIFSTDGSEEIDLDEFRED